MEQNWEQFKSETKKQLSTYLEFSEIGEGKAKHIILDTFDKIHNHVLDVIATLRIINTSKNQREIAVASLLAFLWEFEGSYVTGIDAFCYLLVENGHDLFDIIHHKYAKSFEDIENVNVSTKLQFLDEHNFVIFRRREDKTLRNKIAHHDFVIEKSGKVLINSQVVDISLRFKELHSFTSRVFEIFCSSLDEC